MKKYNIHTTITCLAVLSVMLIAAVSCADVEGDGIDTVIWEGSVLPQDSCYRNPVWEPDLSNPTVFEAAVGYFAMGTDNEWSPGLHYRTPVLSTNDLMSWRLRGEALTESPAQSEDAVTGITAGFSKIKGAYFLFYQLGERGIGMAASKAPQGPYTDFGILIDAESTGRSECTSPFFFPFGSTAYLFFDGGDGMYGTELNLDNSALATLKGDLFKVTGNQITSMTMIRWRSIYYLFGTTESGDEGTIIAGRALDLEGPFVDQDGTDLLNAGGTPVVKGSAGNGFTGVNHIAGVVADSNEELWVLYQATDINQPELSSGKERHPMMLSKLKLSDNGWPTQVVEAAGGWNYPKFPK